MVMDTLISPNGIPSNSIFMSSTVSIGDSGLANIAIDTRVVGIVATVRGQIEGHG